MVEERRRKRSLSSTKSLRYWLEAVAQRDHVDDFVLADATGIMVASSSDRPEIEEVAALAPLLAEPDKAGCVPAQRHQLPVTIQELIIDSAPLYLCAVGEEDCCEEGLENAALGIRRILRN